MITTVGTDIIEVNRIKGAIENLEDKFLNKIFTSKEIDYCEKTGLVKYQHYAVRFAGKEAVYKAISQKLINKSDISWQNAEILNTKTGRPEVNFINLPEYIRNHIQNIDISLSHIKEMAIATCVINWE